MMKRYFAQGWQVMKGNPFYSFISVTGTAVTIAFVMVAYVVYSLNSSDLPPEVHRSRLLYMESAYAYNKDTHGNANRNMAYKTARAITENLESAECAALHTRNAPYTCEAVGAEGGRERRRGRYVDVSWWNIFRYEFVSGRPVSEEDYASNRKVAVITENMARMLFLSTDVAGREMLINYVPYTVCGVVKDVSSQFTVAYCDFWANLTALENIREAGNGSERVNGNIEILVLAKKGKLNGLNKEIEKRVARFNGSLRETTFELKMTGHNEYTFSTLFDFSPVVTYALLISILLIVPAVNISGLISSMLDKRYEEIAIRKVYGASGITVVRQFLSENLLLTFIGGGVGLLLSFFTVYIFRTWLLGVSVDYASSLNLSWWMFFRPSVFLAAFAVCLLFNLLSTYVPVWHASRRNIIDILN